MLHIERSPLFGLLPRALCVDFPQRFGQPLKTLVKAITTGRTGGLDVLEIRSKSLGKLAA